MGVQAAQLKQTASKSNTQGPKLSVFNPRGEKDFAMPRLKCPITFGFTVTPEFHALDREEVELFNLVEPKDDYTIELLDETKQRICVIGTKNHQSGELESMMFKGPKDDQGAYGALFSNESRTRFPALKVLLRQMLGDAADEVVTMKAERAAITRGDLAISVGA